MRTYHLKAVVVKVTEDGSMVADQAYGDSMDGVPGAPATTAIVRGNYPNSSDPIFRAIGAYLVPADAPPQPPVRS